MTLQLLYSATAAYPTGSKLRNDKYLAGHDMTRLLDNWIKLNLSKLTVEDPELLAIFQLFQK